ncbi:MAG: hypothetical protein WC552_06700 [Candidatus Omnitrophota bacterium]
MAVRNLLRKLKERDFLPALRWKRLGLGIFLVCLALFYLLKLQGAQAVGELYQQGRFDILNRLTGAQQQQVLGFYLGEMERKVLGPASVLGAGVLFMVFSLVFLQKASPVRFAIAVFIFFLLSKPEVLFFPPYGDAIGGPFAEGVWLFRNGFNYLGLFHEPRYIDGGPSVYVFSIYPTYLAILMAVFRSSRCFLVVNHLLVFAFAAVIAALFRSILLRIFTPKTSLLLVIFFLSLPLFHSQVEAINMEMFLLFLVMSSVYSLINGKIQTASFWAVAAAFTKGYGVIICGTVFLSSILLFAVSPGRRDRWKFLFWGSWAAASAALAVFLAYIVAYQFTPQSVTSILSGWPSLKNTIIFPLYLLSCVFYLSSFIKGLWRVKREGGSVQSFWERNIIPLVMFSLAGLWFLFFLNHFAVSPRYSLVLLPFLLFAVLFVVALFHPFQKFINPALIGLIVFSLICSYGNIYPPFGGYNYVLQERSLEYRNDLLLNIKVAQEIEEKYASFTIGAPFILAQILALPELGYVHQKLDVMIYGMRCTYGGIKNFQRLSDVQINRTIWVGVRSGLPDDIPYPVGERDVVLKEVFSGKEKAVFFLGGEAIEKARLYLHYLQKKNKVETRIKGEGEGVGLRR